MSCSRSTVSFTENNWEKLKNCKNKSRIVNDALSFFFKAQETLKTKEEEFILNELAHYQDTSEAYSHEEVFNRKS